jgi:hypothetical protein
VRSGIEVVVVKRKKGRRKQLGDKRTKLQPSLVGGTNHKLDESQKKTRAEGYG